MNCTNCPWSTDREACRMCKAEQAVKEVQTRIEVPGAQQRVVFTADESYHFMKERARRSTDIDPATALGNFLLVAGKEHVHYIIHSTDPVEHTDPKYGCQN